MVAAICSKSVKLLGLAMTLLRCCPWLHWRGRRKDTNIVIAKSDAGIRKERPVGAVGAYEQLDALPMRGCPGDP